MKKSFFIFKTSLFFFTAILQLPSGLKAEDIEIQSDYLRVLPHGRTTGSILENWLAPVVYHQVETGGLSRVDDPRYSIRGISWIEQSYRINGIDITDPFRSGYPLFEPAWQSIRGLELFSSGENDPRRTGLNWIVGSPQADNHFEISLHSIFPAGGGSPIPEGEMDREPSFPYGSSNVRRRYKMSGEANGSYYSKDKFYCLGEALATRREFPTLTNRAGNLDEERAEQYKLTMIYKGREASMPFSLLFISGYNENDNYGASARLDNTGTLSQKKFVSHLQYNAGKKIAPGRIKILSGITLRTEDRKPHLTSPRQIEFDTEAGPVPESGEINTLNFDNSVDYTAGIFSAAAGFAVKGVNFRPEIPFDQTVETHEGEAVTVTLWEDPPECDEYLYNTGLNTGLEKRWDFFKLSGNLYFDNTHARANGESLLNWFGIGGKVLAEFDFNRIKTGFHAGLIRRPAKLNSRVIAFLDTGRPSGKSYTGWIDSDGDGIADDSELASANLYRTTGGRYHHKENDLDRPYHDEIFLGAKKEIGRHYKILLRGSHRVFNDYFIVKPESCDGSYSEAPDGTLIYTKQPGKDEYYLSNSDKKSSYSGAEIRILCNWKSVFLDFSFTAFMVTGFAPAGNGPDYNDYAVISESTADPNRLVNSSGGRLDSDRAYKGNLLIGWNILDDLSTGMTVKYRDGEPFSQHRIYRDENGIPVIIMNNERGNWDNRGLGRYTFSWNIDIRLRYTPLVWGNRVAATLDIYNVLDSSTEIVESNNIEDEREALEAVPPRMIKIGLSVLF